MRYTAQNGGCQVYSISSRKLPVYQQIETDSLISKMQRCIKTFRSEITIFSSLDGKIKRIQTDFYAVQTRGLFNGAGVLSDSMTENQLEKVLNSNILGSLNIQT